VNAPVIASAPGNVYAPAPNVPAVINADGTAPPDNVPTLVRLEDTTVAFNVVPVNVPAAAVTVPDAPNAIDVPLTVTDEFARYAFAIALPCQTPVAIVPTDVRDDPTTVAARDVPDNVPAAAVTVIAADPSKLTPLIARAVWSVVAVVALPVNAAVIVPAEKFPLPSRATIADNVFALVAVVAELETLPAVDNVARYVSAIAVKPDPIAPAVNVPTLVNDDDTTVALSAVPVSVPAAAVTVPDAPRLIDVPFTVTALLASAEFGIAVKPDPIAPAVSVPTLVRLDPVTPDPNVVAFNTDVPLI
jgi:hypothetical protein